MRVAFVFNPFKYKLHEENLRIVQKYFGLFPPLSLAWCAAIAERHGHQAAIIDARTLGLTPQETLAELQAFRPDILGFMMTTYMFRETLEWIRYLKSGLGGRIPVMVGGYNLRVYPRESIAPPEIDFGCVEQAYFTLPALLEELEGDRDFSRVPGLAYKDAGGEIVVTPHPQKIVFDDFPAPARHLLPNHLYAEFPTERKNFTVMVTSLGCPMHCTFCEAGRTTYNPRSPETVLDEMQECYERFSVREIDIFDYEFPRIKQRTRAICEGILDRKLDITWACRSRIDSVDKDLLELMYAAGCRRIYYGIESGLQEMLDKVDKEISLDQVKTVISMTKRRGIRPLGFFLVGLPGETEKTVKTTVRFAKSLDLDYVQFSKLTAKPLTGMWRQMVAETGYDYWKEYILGRAEEQVLPRPWTDLSNEEIDRLTRWAYVSYHSRPSFLMRSLLQIKSWDELKRKLLAFLDMLFRQEDVSRADENFQAYAEGRPRFTSRYQKSARLPH
ncbi:MAG TPA: radical SAM protein [bacterium]|nr:radical SAM protein [bacterium]HPJ71276.1 radical SAM protein [bacterium]HPQ66138.1 radical SAM protein [bacterium]